jgi:hypothetical protein
MTVRRKLIAQHVAIPITEAARGKRSMSDENYGKDLEENTKRSSSDPFYEQVISYNVSEAEKPEGLKGKHSGDLGGVIACCAT